MPVMVVTGDRDAYQLVDDGVRVMSTSRGVTDTKVYDREGVIERYGIPPELVPDFIGLKGDTSDNIPGVPGIGDKTAADLLQKFGDLEGVLSNIDNITGAKRKQNLTEHADNARMSKQLATMVRDVEIDIDLEVEFTRTPDRTNLRQVFRDWELRDPLRTARGGPRGRRARGDPAPRGSRHDPRQDRPRPQPVGHQPPQGRVPGPGDRPARDPRGRAPPEGAQVALRRLRRRQHRARGGDRRSRARRPGGRRQSSHRPRRQGPHRGPAEPRLRHRRRRLPARSRPPRLPARRARRGARDRRRRGRRARHHRRPHPRARRQAAPADRRTRPAAAPRRDRAPARPGPARDREARHQARHPAAGDRRHPHQGRRHHAREARSGSSPARSS